MAPKFLRLAMAHLASLSSALASRLKFVEQISEVTEAVGSGDGTGVGSGSAGALFQGGMHKSSTGYVYTIGLIDKLLVICW